VTETVEGAPSPRLGHGRRFEGDELFGSFATLLENEGILLSPTVAQEIDELIADGIPLRWFQEAVKIAACAGKRNLRYVKGIIKNYQAEGFEAKEDSSEPNGADAVAEFLAKYPDIRRANRGDGSPVAATPGEG
jgi:DnaD/phage-associated family protein